MSAGLAYDTAYAMVDREDDLKVGVKSTAILFGSIRSPADRCFHGRRLRFSPSPVTWPGAGCCIMSVSVAHQAYRLPTGS